MFDDSSRRTKVVRAALELARAGRRVTVIGRRLSGSGVFGSILSGTMMISVSTWTIFITTR